MHVLRWRYPAAGARLSIFPACGMSSEGHGGAAHAQRTGRGGVPVWQVIFRDGLQRPVRAAVVFLGRLERAWAPRQTGSRVMRLRRRPAKMAAAW